MGLTFFFGMPTEEEVHRLLQYRHHPQPGIHIAAGADRRAGECFYQCTTGYLRILGVEEGGVPTRAGRQLQKVSTSVVDVHVVFADL